MKETPKQIPTLPLSDLKESVQREIIMLNNIEKFLRRVRDISGDEAEYFVEAKKYIKNRVASVYQAEVFRLQALQKIEEAKKADPEAEVMEAPKVEENPETEEPKKE